MYPVLFSIGSFNIYSYGVMLALGLLLGTLVNCRLAASNGFSKERIQSAILWIMLAALVGARIFYVIIEPQEFSAEPWRVFYIWEGGLVFYGGFIGGILMSLWLARRWKVPVLRLYDNLVPGLALGHALGRVGCFLAGCCYGLPWDGFCAVEFNHPQTLAPRGVHLHASQLYEAFSLLVVGIILLMFWGKRKRAGQVACLYGILAGLERIIAEQFRGDWRGAPLEGIAWLTPTMLVAICILVMSLFGFIILSRKKA